MLAVLTVREGPAFETSVLIVGFLLGTKPDEELGGGSSCAISGF